MAAGTNLTGTLDQARRLSISYRRRKLQAGRAKMSGALEPRVHMPCVYPVRSVGIVH